MKKHDKAKVKGADEEAKGGEEGVAAGERVLGGSKECSHQQALAGTQTRSRERLSAVPLLSPRAAKRRPFAGPER